MTSKVIFGNFEWKKGESTARISSFWLRWTDEILVRWGVFLPAGSTGQLIFLPASWVPHLRRSFPWARLGSGPLHPEKLYLGWRQGPTPSTAFDDRMSSFPPSGVESGNMTIGPQNSYQTSYHVPSDYCDFITRQR
ncbi:hypothetical protein F2Q69_00045406 [Brassica cretica]|uniref:Uncharacterized protein n=1 Tax=Brassica cretica TaxID=69181 RepID=A0A8S9NQV2_BRACR|nr:hypothetical protein F2Q69_00045406 [Brassica cretica]